MPVTPKYDPRELRETKNPELDWTVMPTDNGAGTVLVAKVEGNQEYRITTESKAGDPRSADGELLMLSRKLVDESMFFLIRKSRKLGELQAEAEELAGHRIELAGLDRKRGMCGSLGPVSAPWGKVQTVEQFAPEVFSVSTAGHGGMKLLGAMQRNMPASLKVKGGWYEEDAEWSKVATAYPDLFTSFERRHGEKTLRNSYPEAWEEFYGLKLKEGESVQRDQETFNERHKDDLIVTSALYSSEHPGFTEVWAQKGPRTFSYTGKEEPQYQFLVADDEYKARGPFGFVIDPDRHQQIGGESLTQSFKP